MNENLSEGDKIRAINRIYDTDRAERIKHPKLRTALIVIATVLILTVPCVLIVAVIPNVDTSPLIDPNPFALPNTATTVAVWLYGAIIAVPIAILLIRRSIMTDKFLAVKDAKNVFIQTTLEKPEDFKPIIAANAIVFHGDLDDTTIDLIYNWLRYRRLLKDTAPHFYTFTGRSLRDATKPDIQVIDHDNYHAISIADLDTKSPDFNKFIKEHNAIINTTWLQSMIQ